MGKLQQDLFSINFEDDITDIAMLSSKENFVTITTSQQFSTKEKYDMYELSVQNMTLSSWKQVITKLTPGQSYCFRVSAFNLLGYGQSKVSTPPCITPPIQIPTLPLSNMHKNS